MRRNQPCTIGPVPSSQVQRRMCLALVSSLFMWACRGQNQQQLDNDGKRIVLNSPSSLDCAYSIDAQSRDRHDVINGRVVDNSGEGVC
jgi:hypothetical protein